MKAGMMFQFQLFKRRLYITISAMLFIALFPPVESMAQFSNRNAFQLEIGGHGLIYSIGYERTFINSEKFKALGDLGIGVYPEKTGFIVLWVPTVISGLISFDKHHLVAGIGHVYTKDHFKKNEIPMTMKSREHFFTGRLGYRYQKPGDRLFFEAAFTPFLEYGIYDQDPDINIDEYKMSIGGFHPSGGISIGFTF